MTTSRRDNPPPPAAVPFEVLALWRAAGREIRLRTGGNSMRPLIETGDEVAIRLIPPRRLRPGDIMAFRRGNAVVIHRFLGKRTSSGKTLYCEKGDRLLGWTWIPEGDIIGKVVRIHGRKRTLGISDPPWRWVNRAAGLIFASWVTAAEFARASLRGGPRRIDGSSIRCPAPRPEDPLRHDGPGPPRRAASFRPPAAARPGPSRLPGALLRAGTSLLRALFSALAAALLPIFGHPVGGDADE